MTMSFYENMNQLCKVCGEPAAGFHFGAFTCEGCKSFFGRTCNNVTGISECKSGGSCEITKKNRTSCKNCRLKKCLAVGMSKSGSRYGRRSNWFKIHCLLTSQNQGNSSEGAAGMTMNNTTNKTNSNLDNSRKNTSAFQNNLNIGTNGMISTLSPTPTSSFTTSGLSPESREQFLLSSFGQKFNNPELVDYFRFAKQKGSESFFDASNNNKQSSARSSYSPKSDVSEEELKTASRAAAPLPLPVPDNNNKDISKFDLFARDLMKMGYDPMRLWSSMLGVPPQNLGQLNPYGLMFPNAFPFGVLPPSSAALSSVSHPSLLLGGAINPSKFLSSGIGMQQGLSTQSPKTVESDSESKSKNLQSGRDSVSPSSSRESPMYLPKDRITPIIPSSPNLIHSPPINFYNLKASVDVPQYKHFSASPQEEDVPIDLSAKTTNNNYVDDYETKRFDRVNNKTNSPIQSDSDDDERVPFSHRRNQLIEQDISRRHYHIYNSHYDFQPQSLVKRKVERRQSIDEDNDKVEGEDEFTSNNNNNEVMKPGIKRRSSNSFDYDVVNPKREKVSSPLNLIRNIDSNIPKIVT